MLWVENEPGKVDFKMLLEAIVGQKVEIIVNGTQKYTDDAIHFFENVTVLYFLTTTMESRNK